MNISPVNFTGTIYFPNQRVGINTDHIVRFEEGKSGRVEAYLSNDEMTTLPVNIYDFVTAYKKAIKGKDEFVEIKTNSRAAVSI